MTNESKFKPTGKIKTLSVLLILFFLYPLITFAALNPVSLKITSDWGSGFNGNITISNTTVNAFESWQVEFDFPYSINSIWNARIVSHTGNHYVIKNASWNGSLNPGQSTTFGFGGTPGNVNSDISNVKINGASVEQEVNTTPLARNDNVVTEKNNAVTFNVIQNDSAPGGNTIELTSISNQPQNGTAAIVSSSEIKYTPKTNFTGTDTFSYVIKNSKGETATGTVTIAVNNNASIPSVNGFEYKVTGDWGSGFNGQITVTNTTDKTSDGWNVEFDYPYGIASIWNAQIKSHSGNHYVIENLSWNKNLESNQSTSFGFGATPGNATIEPANVVLNFNNGNSSEEETLIAVNDSLITDFNTSKSISPLSNDKGNNISLTSVSNPSHGVVEVSGNNVEYTPETNYSGTDSYNYTITDANGKTATANVNIEIKNVATPIAQNDVLYVTKNITSEANVLSNDTGTDLTINSVTKPEHGTAAIENNKIKYTPDYNYIGSDSFDYTIKNALGLLATGTVAVTVRDQVAVSKVNATYWCAWGGNTSYSVDGKTIASQPVDMNQVDSSYNVLITAFIECANGNYYLNTGSLSSDSIKDQITAAKAQGRKVIVSLGGEKFKDASIKTEAEAAKFVSDIEQIIDEYGFEGLDIDIESSIIGPSGNNINPELLGQALTQITDHYRNSGKDFWLTAAPQWVYIIPYCNGSGQWASHSLYGDFYVNLINKTGINNFTYIWPQSYNEGSANGVTGDSTGTKVTPASGMDKFIAALAWGISTEEGYKANGSVGVFIPGDKLGIGIPATEGAAGLAMTYAATPQLIKNAWNIMNNQGTSISGFMNWSVDWDATNIPDGALSTGYTHASWETGKAVAETIGLGGEVNLNPTVSFTKPSDNEVIEQDSLSPVNILISAINSDGEIADSYISVDGQNFSGTSANWTPSHFGNFVITVAATDNNGSTVEKTINVVIAEKEESGGGEISENIPPSLVFSTPVNNATLTQKVLSPVTISVAAEDSDGTVISVQISVDDQNFYSSTAQWTPSHFGEFNVTASAIDDKGGISSKELTVNVVQYNIPENKQIVGYFTQWDAWKGTNHGFPAKGTCNQLNVDYSKYTILNFSFFGVAKDGSLHSADFADKQLYQEGSAQEPAELLNGDIYSSWDYWLLYGELNLLWEANAEATDAGYVVDGNSWYNTKTGLTGPMPIPLHKKDGAKGLIELCKENNVKLVATIGGWSMSKHIPEMAADPAKKLNFLNDCKKLINMGFDGIDIDWEFPGPFPGMNYTGSNADFANFTALMRDIRNSIGSDKLITAAFSCSPERLEGFNWTELDQYMDYYNVMSYDMNGGWSDNAGHNTPLYGEGLCWDNTYEYLTQVKNVPAHKINMGLGFYGRGVVTNGKAALNAPTVKSQRTVQPDGPISTAADFANWGNFDGCPNFGYIMKNMDGWAYNWDDNAKVPYLTKDNYFLSFDDECSVQCKADYVLDKGLGGVIVWQVFGDWDTSEVETTYANKLPYCPNVATPLLDVLHHTFETNGEASHL